MSHPVFNSVAALAWVCADAVLLVRTGSQWYAVTGLLVYFGGKDMPVYEGVASLWFEEAGALAAFRAYQEDLEERNRQTPFFTSSESFFLMAREVPII